jgi:predicted transcriptional regulator
MTERTAKLTLLTTVAVTVTLVALVPATATAGVADDASPGQAVLPGAATAPADPQFGLDSVDADETIATIVDTDEAIATIVDADEQITTVVERVPADSPETVTVVLAGYSRWDDSDPLVHETRRELHDAVVESPGVSLSTLADRTGTNPSTLRYHCRVLEREGLVESEKRHGQRRLFPAVDWMGEDAPIDSALSAALEDETLRAVLRVVYRTEPVSVGDLASELDVTPSTASHHLGRLADDGLVERQSQGRTVHTSLTATTRSAIEESVGP